MTKKEQAAFAALKEEMRIAQAWRFSDPVDPDVPAPTEYGARSKGFLPVGSPVGGHGSYVTRAWSEANRHYVGDRAWDHRKEDYLFSTEGPMALSSTAALAWRALRYRACVDTRMALARIDRMIEEAEAEV